jgi:hypothetical protein
VKSSGDIELQPDGLDNSYPRNVRILCWKAGDEDVNSEKQRTAGSGNGIRKTTVVEWESVEARAPSYVFNSKAGVPKPSFQSAA